MLRGKRVRPLRVVVLSNGYGEDVVGSLIARELRAYPQVKVQAFPTVDEGMAYERARFEVLGPRQVMPSGGLLLHNRTLFWQDIRAGFIPMTLKQLRDLRQIKCDVLLVVGDIYALLLSSLVRTNKRFFVQTLVSAYHRQDVIDDTAQTRRKHRFFMETISYPERFLMRQLAARTYVRDAATRDLLKSQGVRAVSAFGNPMLDALNGEPITAHATDTPVLALLPGTRQYATNALSTMLQALTHLPKATALIAWAGKTLPDFSDWQPLEFSANERGLIGAYQRGEVRVFVYTGRFADVLCSADMALGTAGTANEQAAALGKPLVSFAVPPLYSEAFLENQRRLLGQALTVCAPEPAVIAASVQGLLADASLYEQAARMGRERMGKPGGARAIAADVMLHLQRFELP